MKKLYRWPETFTALTPSSRSSARDVVPLSVFLGTIWHFWASRNAYYGALGSQSFRSELTHVLSEEHAKAFIEDHRTQGTSWQMRSLPALVLDGSCMQLVVIDKSPNEPFSGVSVLVECPESLDDAIRAFQSPRAALEMFLVPGKTVGPAELPFRQYSSISGEAGEPLQWRHSDAWAPSLTFMMEHVCSVTALLQSGSR